MNFDGLTKRIILAADTNTVTATGIYSRWKEWAETADNSKFLQAMRTTGGDPLPGGQSVGAFYFLLNGWKILPNSRDHELLISGNLFSEDGSAITSVVGGGFSVIVRLQTSSLTLQAAGGDAVVDNAAVAAAVWDRSVALHNSSGTFGLKFKKNLVR